MAAGEGQPLSGDCPAKEFRHGFVRVDDLDMTTDTRFRVFANFYRDSVVLMQMGVTLRKRPGIVEASCVMAAPANLQQSARWRRWTPESIGVDRRLTFAN